MPQHFANAAYLAIGSEILSGRTQEKNLASLAEFLAPRGIPLREARVVPDHPEAIAEAVSSLRTRAAMLVTSGGIGPTHDDITSAVIANLFARPLRVDPIAYQALDDYYTKAGKRMTKPRQKMAMLPQGAVPIGNAVSIAPGFRIENVYVLAGVPQVFRAMLAEIDVQGTAFRYEESIETTLGESLFAEALSALQAEYPRTDIGSYPRIDHSTASRWRNAIVVSGCERQQVRAVARAVRSMVEAVAGGEGADRIDQE